MHAREAEAGSGEEGDDGSPEQSLIPGIALAEEPGEKEEGRGNGVETNGTNGMQQTKPSEQEGDAKPKPADPGMPMPAMPFPRFYEYDYRNYDHSQLVYDAYSQDQRAPGGLDNLAAVALGAAAANYYGPAAVSAFPPMYPFSIVGLDSLAAAALGQPEPDYNPFRYNPFGLYGYMPTAYDNTMAKPEPNPLDDFAAVTDTVRRMEEEASQRSKKRGRPGSAGSAGSSGPQVKREASPLPDMTGSSSASTPVGQVHPSMPVGGVDESGGDHARKRPRMDPSMPQPVA
ncbi:hypothetical protein HK104_000658 [Borealophlyctis nickersoniae]|nr:hypothetical protein HK104_000658 [Borealophlyctis nickersoniae]